MIHRIVNTLRLNRFLGRVQLAREAPPSKPNVAYFWGIAWWLKALLGVVALVAVYYVFVAVSFILQEAVDLAIALGLLLTFPAFRAWLFPLLRREPIRSRILVDSSPAIANFAYGAVPATALALAPFPDVAPVAIAALAGGLSFKSLALAVDGKTLPAISFSRPQVVTIDAEPEVDLTVPGDFGFFIGRGTGTLAKLGHKAGLASGAAITLNLRDACKHFWIAGESGTGKTSRVVLNIAVQALDLGAGILAFDPRGDFAETMLLAARMTGRDVQRVGPGFARVNLIEGLSANASAAFLRAAFRLSGQGSGESAVWVNAAVARCENALAVLAQIPGAYNLAALYGYVFEPAFRAAQIERAQLILDAGEGNLGAIELRRLQSAVDHEAIVAGYDAKLRSSIDFTIGTLLSVFTDPEIADAFCSSTEAEIADVCIGSVFLVNLPPRFADATRVVYGLLKERFHESLNGRAQMADGPRKSTPVVFLCDEHQMIAADTDTRFWDKARALNCIAVCASQSVEGYIAAMNGDEYAAIALLASFTNVIAFRSTARTMAFVAEKLGPADFWKTSETAGRGTERILGFKVGTSSINDGRALSEERRELITAQLFRSLAVDECIALLSVDGKPYDDVLRVSQLLNSQMETFS